MTSGSGIVISVPLREGLLRCLRNLLMTSGETRDAEILGDRDAIWDLIARSQGGDHDAFTRLYRLHYPTVSKYVSCRVENSWTAEDIVNETFTRAWRGIKRVSRQETRDLGSWLVTIARHLIIDESQSGKLQFVLDADDLVKVDTFPKNQPEASAVTLLTRETLIKAVKQLSTPQQECVTCRYLLDLSVADTARIMNMPENAVKQLQLRSKRSLQRLLPEWVNPAWEETGE